MMFKATPSTECAKRISVDGAWLGTNASYQPHGFVAGIR